MNSTDSEWLAGLNGPQREAAEYSGGPLLIVAGAGSGKTRVIVHRVAHLIKAVGVDPWNLLAVTFTNKAAEEMSHRIGGLLGRDASGAWISTFHGLGARILRMEAETIGYPSSFVIYDDSDQLSLLKTVIKDSGLDPKKVTPKSLRSWVDAVKREAIDMEDVATFPDPRIEPFVPLLTSYQERLKASNAVDFGDLLFLTYKLFKTSPETLAKYRDRFRHVLVDEYQDTNRVQYLIVRELVGDSGSICVVGDEDQSIYGWRGADLTNILNFESDYPEAKVVMLEQNYRSTKSIIEASSAVISHNSERKNKRLWSDGPRGSRVRLYTANDDREEARWVIEEALRRLGMGRGLSEMAVFYRTHAQSRVIEDALRARDLHYVIYGGTRFYDRKEIKDILAYLKLVLNPEDEVALLRVINLPARGVGAKTIEAVAGLKRLEEIGWLEAVEEVIIREAAGKKARGGLEEFLKIIRVLQGKMDASLPGLVRDAIELSGYSAMLEKEGGVEAQSRLENLEELINAATDHAISSDDPSLAGFLEKVSLAQDMDRFDASGGNLTLMTIHSAKGLEFPVVFMVGMEEGLFPHSMSIFHGPEGFERRALEEERRLCYVGMTRAKEELTMTRALQRVIKGRLEFQRPSQFLAEIPEDLVETIGAARPSQAGLFETGRGTARARAKSKTREKKREGRRVDFGDSEIIYDEPVSDEGFERPDGVVFAPGCRVYHDSFGEGVVKRLEESGDKTRVVVKFARGTKKFLAIYAPLILVD